MHEHDLLPILSTCSDLRRMLRAVFSKALYIIPPFCNTAVFFSDTGISRIHILMTKSAYSHHCLKT